MNVAGKRPVVAGLLGLLLCGCDGRAPSQPDAAAMAPPAATRGYDRFRVEGLSIREQQGTELLFTLTAEQVVHRKRRTELFVYHNLKEIALSRVRLAILHPFHPAAPGRISLPFDRIGKSFESLAPSPDVIDDYLAGRADIDLDILSRVLFDDLTIDVALPAGRRVALRSVRARIGTDFRHIVFSDGFVLTSADGTTLSAPRAVWSRKFGGLYFPEGYRLRGRTHAGTAFFDLTAAGGAVRRLAVPQIDYDDPLEVREQVLQQRLAARMPVYARMMFGLAPYP